VGIPAVRDRVVQAAAKVVLEPIFEADFRSSSYGFRPRRSAHQATEQLRQAVNRGTDWVVDADIAAFFDRIDHAVLLKLVERRISDRRMLKLLGQWLKAGVLDATEYVPSDQGVPQGGVISPLLANVMLHELDRFWEDYCSPLGQLIRYADDVRHITRYSIPFTERRGSEDQTSGSTAYLAAKAQGDGSMPLKRGRAEDAYGRAPQDPRDMVKATLLEPQSPAMEAYIPRAQRPRRGRRDRVTKSSSLEPSAWRAVRNERTQGNGRGTYVALDTSSIAGMWDHPPRREAQGDGAAVVLCGRESRPLGEGRQVL
jgi:hypothetical protein